MAKYNKLYDQFFFATKTILQSPMNNGIFVVVKGLQIKMAVESVLHCAMMLRTETNEDRNKNCSSSHCVVASGIRNGPFGVNFCAENEPASVTTKQIYLLFLKLTFSVDGLFKI